MRHSTLDDYIGKTIKIIAESYGGFQIFDLKSLDPKGEIDDKGRHHVSMLLQGIVRDKNGLRRITGKIGDKAADLPFKYVDNNIIFDSLGLSWDGTFRIVKSEDSDGNVIYRAKNSKKNDTEPPRCLPYDEENSYLRMHGLR